MDMHLKLYFSAIDKYAHWYQDYGFSIGQSSINYVDQWILYNSVYCPFVHILTVSVSLNTF